MKKKTFFPILILCMTITFLLGVTASSNLHAITAFLNHGISVAKDGQIQVLTDEQGNSLVPITYNDSTYLPVRAISNILGHHVAWDGDTQCILLDHSTVPSALKKTTYKGIYTKPLKMSTNAAFPPYEYKEGENFIGIDIEIATAIAEELGTTLEIVDMEFGSIIDSVQQAQTDFGMAGMTVTVERTQKVNFTSAYISSIQVVLVPKDSNIITLDDLEGKKIGTLRGTVGDLYCKYDYGEENVTSFDEAADAVIALYGGNVDAVITEMEIVQSFIVANKGLRTLEMEYALEDYAIAVAKGNEELLHDLNAAIYNLRTNGTIDSIVRKYIKLK